MEDDGKVLGPLTPWTEKDLEIVDLGDAGEETKQCRPDPAIFPDSWFGWGAVEWHPGGGCPWN